MFQTKVVDKIKINIISNNVFPRTVPFFRNVVNYGTAKQATDYNTTHTLCMLDN